MYPGDGTKSKNPFKKNDCGQTPAENPPHRPLLQEAALGAFRTFLRSGRGRAARLPTRPSRRPRPLESTDYDEYRVTSGPALDTEAF